MNIIVKKTPSHSMFRPHFNRSTGKYYHTKKEYISDMKRNGLEPYNPDSVKPFKERKYKPSQWAHEMLNNVSYDRKGKPILGDRWIKEVNAQQFKKVPKDLIGKTKLNNMEGGWLE